MARSVEWIQIHRNVRGGLARLLRNFSLRSLIILLALVSALSATFYHLEPWTPYLRETCKSGFRDFTFTRSGRFLLAREFSQALRVWRVEKREEILITDVPTTSMHRLFGALDGERMVAIGSWRCAIYDGKSGASVARWHEEYEIYGAGLSPSGRTLLLTGRHRRRSAYDLSTGKAQSVDIFASLPENYRFGVRTIRRNRSADGRYRAYLDEMVLKIEWRRREPSKFFPLNMPEVWLLFLAGLALLMSVRFDMSDQDDRLGARRAGERDRLRQKQKTD